MRADHRSWRRASLTLQPMLDGPSEADFAASGKSLASRKPPARSVIDTAIAALG